MPGPAREESRRRREKEEVGRSRKEYREERYE
jgi:hypothetical protein